jgi:hypothetical protein
MGNIKNLSDTSFVDNIKKGITAQKLRAVHELIESEIAQKTTEIAQISRPISVVGTSTSSILNVNNPYPANTLSSIAIYKQIYIVGNDTEVGYQQVIPTKITKNLALQNDSYKIEGLEDGKYHIVFSPSAVFTPYTV